MKPKTFIYIDTKYDRYQIGQNYFFYHRLKEEQLNNKTFLEFYMLPINWGRL